MMPPITAFKRFDVRDLIRGGVESFPEINQRAMKGELEITAISIHAYPYVADKYALTSCGSSMGDKYGPMVITREPMKLEALRGKKIDIPGKLTTAFLALQLSNLLGGSVIIESIFALPGVGTLTVNAIATKDYTVIQGCVLFFGCIVVLVNLLVDVSYGFIDPRLRRS